MADLEDALSPTWANVVGGQAAIADATRGTLTFDSPEGKAYRLGRGAGDARRPAARLAPHRVARARGRRAGLGVAVRLRDVPVPLGRGGDRGGERAVPLPRQARVAPRGAPLERRLRPRPGGARDPARHRSGRPCSSRRSSPPSRWTRSCTSCASTPPGSTPAAGTTCSASSRSSGRDPRHGLAGPRPADDDRAVHAGVHGAARPDLPSARRARDRRDGGVHPEPARPGGHRDGARARSATTRTARAATGSTGRGSPIRTSCRSRSRSSMACSATARTRRSGRREEVAVAAADLLDLRVAGGAVTEAGVRANVRVALAYLDSWLRGVGRGGHRQPDGGRGDGRDQPLAALAVDHPGGRPRRRRAVHPERYATIRDEELARLGGRARAGSRRPPTCSTGSSSTTTSPSS